MEAIRIEVNVNVGLTPAAERVLSGLMGMAGAPAPVMVIPEEKVEPPAEAPALPVEPEQPAQPVETVEPEQAQPVETVAPVEPEAGEKAGEIDDDALRYWMDQRITELAGPKWMASKEPSVIQVRRNCTSCFKEIARYLGAEKPTALPQEKREAFIGHLKELEAEPGTVNVTWKPF